LSSDLGRAQAFTENVKGGMLTYLHSRTVPLSHRSTAPSQPVPHRRLGGVTEGNPHRCSRSAIIYTTLRESQREPGRLGERQESQGWPGV
jgi:hypothetical protein